MNAFSKSVFLVASMAVSSLAFANEVEGPIDNIDEENESFEVQGIELKATENTEYNDGVNSFSDLSVGQDVEVDFTYEEGEHRAKKVELKD